MSFYVRSYNIEKLYYLTKNIYQNHFKKNIPWNIQVEDLLMLPVNSLGHSLGEFLNKHNFRVEPKLENHDIFHILANIGITVPEEVALQYYLLANKKISSYLCMVILSGTIFYPDKWTLFIKSYFRGLQAKPFHHLDYLKYLRTPIDEFKFQYQIT